MIIYGLSLGVVVISFTEVSDCAFPCGVEWQEDVGGDVQGDRVELGLLYQIEMIPPTVHDEVKLDGADQHYTDIQKYVLYSMGNLRYVQKYSRLLFTMLLKMTRALETSSILTYRFGNSLADCIAIDIALYC